MRVMLTGATGFIGGHTLAALMAAGHEVRALVRDGDKLDRMLAMHGIDGSAGRVEAVLGDMTDHWASETNSF